MSQNICHSQQAGLPVRVVIGWDPPLQEHFCFVEAQANGPGDRAAGDVVLITEPGANLDNVRELLAAAGIAVPAAMYAAAQQDQVDNIANEMRHF